LLLEQTSRGAIMKHTVLTTAFLVSIVSTLAVSAPRPAVAGASLAGLIRSEVMSAVGTAKGAVAEAEMRQLRAKAAMAAKVKAAMEAQAALANGSGAVPALPVACPTGGDWPSMDERPSLVENDRCR
jgi:hypothetical protein